jgi:hypothetical protein
MSLNPTNLYIQAAPLPATFKGNPNDLFVAMIQRMRILSPSGTNFIFIGDTEPTSNVGPWLKNGSQWYVWDESTKRYVPQNISASFTAPYFIGNAQPSSATPNLWLQTSKTPAPGSTDYGDPLQWFMWNGSAWVWPHDIPPSSGIRQMWAGSEADLWFFDGGDGTDPALATPMTGAMWMVDTVFNLKSPRGALVGTLNPGASTGADSATITIPSYLPAHFHNESIVSRTGDAVTKIWGNGTQSAGNPGAALKNVTTGGPNNDAITTTTDTQGGGALPTVVVPTIPASVGTFFIKRSARKFYTPA